MPKNTAKLSLLHGAKVRDAPLTRLVAEQSPYEARNVVEECLYERKNKKVKQL